MTALLIFAFAMALMGYLFDYLKHVKDRERLEQRNAELEALIEKEQKKARL